ncbi:hypothetical protein ENTCAN_08210 [Enterobacter cancerogenus ATCC 35316]|nr:hypothetical protein ENTCAN_08210 [Enterobacter cancerogenus ATCC 35316]
MIFRQNSSPNIVQIFSAYTLYGAFLKSISNVNTFNFYIFSSL